MLPPSGTPRLATQQGILLLIEERVVRGIFPPPEVPRYKKVIRVNKSLPT